MSKTPFPRAPWPWADPLWWARQQIRATTYVAHMTEAVVRASLAAYNDAARSSVHALGHGSAPWGAWGIATATSAASVRETPVTAEPLIKAAEPLVKAAEPLVKAAVTAVHELNGQPTQPRPELTPVPPAAELTPVPPEPELTAVPSGARADGRTVRARADGRTVRARADGRRTARPGGSTGAGVGRADARLDPGPAAPGR